MSKILTVMVGLPRAGKTTFRNPYAVAPIALVICADDIRLKVYNQRFWAEGEPLMWHIRGIMLESALEQGFPIYVDETNISVVRRKKIIELGKKHGYWIRCIWVQTSKDECIKRAELTDMPDLVPVIKYMAGKFEPPSSEEGFDQIIKV